MTINSDKIPVTVTQGNGSTNRFQTDFVVIDEDHLTVKLYNQDTGEKLDASPFNFEGLYDDDGCSFDLPSAPAANQKVVMYGDIPLTQLIDFINNERLSREAVELAFDILLQQVKQLQAQIDKCVRIDIDDPTTSLDALPDELLRKDGVLGFDGDSILVVKTGADNHADAAGTHASEALAHATSAEASSINAAYDADRAEAAASGKKWKPSARAATTGNITLTGEQTIDGVSLSDGDVCLVKHQTNAAENGLYMVSESAWTRHILMNEWDEVPSAAVAVEEGTSNGDLQFICLADQGGTLGATDMIWGTLGSSNLADEVTTTKTGNVISVKDGGIGTEQLSDGAVTAQKFATGAGMGLFPFLHIQDQKANGVHGGTFNSGDWRTRDLNTILVNDIEGASLDDATGILTLPAHTYWIQAYAPCHDVGDVRALIYDETNAGNLLIGRSNSVNSAYSGSFDSTVFGRMQLGDITNISLKQRCTDSKSSNGFGRACTFGLTEVFSEILIWQLD